MCRRFVEAIQAAQQSVNEYQECGDPEAGEAAGEIPHRDFGLRSLKIMSSMVEPLVELAPGPQDDAAAILAKAKKFLRHCARADCKLDRYARGKLLDDIDGMLTGLQLGPGTDLDVIGWLEELPMESRIMASGPQPGRVHVAPLSRGGHAGRTNVYAVGLDDARYPRRISVDPVVLDSERTKLSNDLPTSVELAEDTKWALDRALYRILVKVDAKVFLSYSARNITEDRSSFPSAGAARAVSDDVAK